MASRDDEPGSWHHVGNRGLSRRPIFESLREVRLFQGYLARLVRKGLIEVHAYSMLVNHFHLLIRSPRGEISRAMQYLESLYVRRFNAVRDRDGPLFRGRFFSKRVRSETYWRTLLRYIDQNAVSAGLATRPEEYALSSAYHYARARGPIWLDRTEVEAVVMGSRDAAYDPRRYAARFGFELGAAATALVESRVFSRATGEDPLDDLLNGPAGYVRQWLESRARLADASPIGVPLVTPETLLGTLESHQAREARAQVTVGGRPRGVWPILRAGLLRIACGESWSRIGILCGCSTSTAHARASCHEAKVRADPIYAELAAGILKAAVDADWRHGWADDVRVVTSGGVAG
jgi:REP element-mobilizing transposase RayT